MFGHIFKISILVTALSSCSLNLEILQSMQGVSDLPSTTPSTPTVSGTGQEKVIINNFDSTSGVGKLLKLENDLSITEVNGNVEWQNGSSLLPATSGSAVAASILTVIQDRYLVIDSYQHTTTFDMQSGGSRIMNGDNISYSSFLTSVANDFLYSYYYAYDPIAGTASSVACQTGYGTSVVSGVVYSVKTWPSYGLVRINSDGSCTDIGNSSLPSSAGSSVLLPFEYNGSAYYYRRTGGGTYDLYEISGTTGNWIKSGFVYPPLRNNPPYSNMVTVGAKVYFVANINLPKKIISLDFSNPANPIETDEVTFSNYLVVNDPTFYMLSINGRVLVYGLNAATTGFSLYELTGGSLTELFAVVTQYEYTTSGYVPPFQHKICNSKVYFANSGASGNELYLLQGNNTAATLVSNINAGNASSYPRNLKCVENTLYFVADDGDVGYVFKLAPTDVVPVKINSLNSNDYLLPASPAVGLPINSIASQATIDFAELAGNTYIYTQTKPAFTVGYSTGGQSYSFELPYPLNDQECNFLDSHIDTLYIQCDTHAVVTVLYEVTCSGAIVLGTTDYYGWVEILATEDYVLFSSWGKLIRYDRQTKTKTILQRSGSDFGVAAQIEKKGDIIYIADNGRLYSVSSAGTVTDLVALPCAYATLRAVGNLLIVNGTDFIYEYSALSNNFTTLQFDGTTNPATADMPATSNMDNRFAGLTKNQKKVLSQNGKSYFLLKTDNNGSLMASAYYIDESTHKIQPIQIAVDQDTTVRNLWFGDIFYFQTDEASNSFKYYSGGSVTAVPIGPLLLSSEVTTQGAFLIEYDGVDVIFAKVQGGVKTTVATVMPAALMGNLMSFANDFYSGDPTLLLASSFKGNDFLYPVLTADAGKPYGFAITYKIYNTNTSVETTAPFTVDESKARFLVSADSTLLVDANPSKHYIFVNEKALPADPDNGYIYSINGAIFETVASGLAMP